MNTTRVLSYNVLASSILAASLILGSPAMLLMIIPIVIMIGISEFVYPVRRPLLEVTRRITSNRVFVGEEVKVKLAVRNCSNDEVYIHVVDRLSDGCRVVEGGNEAFMYLGPLQEAFLEYKLRFDSRGHYEIGPVEVNRHNPLHFDAESFNIYVVDAVAVFPAYEDLRGFRIGPRRTGTWPGDISSRLIGTGSEFYQLRDYAPGDEIRRINWKATAKRSKLISNEYEGERVTDVLLVMDVGGEHLIGERVLDLVEAEVSATASLASLFIRRGNRVGLLIYGSYRHWIGPGFGRKQLLKILHALADVSPVLEKQDISLGGVVKNLLSLIMMPETQVIIVTPFASPHLEEVVAETLALGYSTLVLAVDPYSFIDPVDKEEEVAKRMLSMAWRVEVQGLSRLCSVAIWDGKEPLNRVFSRLKSPSRVLGRGR